MDTSAPQTRTCAQCGSAQSDRFAQGVPAPAASPYTRVAGRRPLPASPCTGPASQPNPTAAPQRVKVASRKAAPSAAATREARERRKMEEEAAALNAVLKITRPRAPTTTDATDRRSSVGSEKEAESQATGGDGEKDDDDDDEEDGYYKISEHPELTVEERMEAIRKAHEARLEEKAMEMRRRQGIARRPKALLRTRYGQLKSIESTAANAEGRRSSRDEDNGPLLLDDARPASPQKRAGDDTMSERDAPSAEEREGPVEAPAPAVDAGSNDHQGPRNITANGSGSGIDDSGSGEGEAEDDDDDGDDHDDEEDNLAVTSEAIRFHRRPERLVEEENKPIRPPCPVQNLIHPSPQLEIDLDDDDDEYDPDEMPQDEEEDSDIIGYRPETVD